MSESVKQFKELENQIFREYYYSNFLPSVIGGSPNTGIMQFLEALQSIMNSAVSATEISRDWISDVSWFTKRLEDLFQLPRFRDESDREYFNRLIELVDARQDEGTIQTVISTLIGDAITLLSDITFSFQTAQGNWGDDAVPASYSLFWSNTPNDVWGDANTTLRAIMKVIIQFANNLQNGLIAHYRLDGDVKDSSTSIETIDTSVDNITFTNGSPDTISRASGDWTTILEVGQNIILEGSKNNDSKYQIASLTSSTLTLDSDSQLTNETMSTGTLTINIEHNRHGTNNGVTFDYSKWNYGGIFDGSNYIELPSEVLKSTGSISMEIIPYDLTTEQYYFWHFDSGNRLYIRHNSSGELVIGLGDSASYSTGYFLTENKRHNIILTWDAGTFFVYVNDTQVYTDSYTNFTPNQNPRLGTEGGENFSFIGEIDNVLIFSRVITSAERSLLYSYKSTYNYWAAPMNYTKIAQMIDLYRPPGIDFEIELNY